MSETISGTDVSRSRTATNDRCGRTTSRACSCGLAASTVIRGRRHEGNAIGAAQRRLGNANADQ
jgi:hypothetical protein